MTAASGRAGSAKDGPLRLDSAVLRSRFEMAAASVACLLTILSFTRVMPVPPQDGLDPSWKYALDFASARGMPFGRALVFTFGPLVSLYTDVRVPEHDALYLIAESVVALGIFMGFLLSSVPGRRPCLLVLPLILSNLLIKDAALLVLPLTMVLATCRRAGSSAAWHPAFALLAVANGLLLLVKGSLILPVAVCTALSCAALLRDRSLWALLLPLLVSGTALFVWLAMGQPLAGLPNYTANLVKITDGYTDAMSIAGPSIHPLAFIAASAVLAAIQAWIEPRHRTVVVLASLFLAFIAFKAGFVRQDGHATLAGAFLALSGLLILLQAASRRAYLGLIGIVGWYVIASAHVPFGAPVLVTRLIDGIGDSARGIALRWRHPDQTFAAYEAAKVGLRERTALPRLEGTVDIYPVDIAPLLASDLGWSPRPVLQSYSAYLPALAAMNARHLEGPNAPGSVLFDVAPIDDRFPSLEDGASWPALLSRYEFERFSGPYALLHRTDTDHHARIGARVTDDTFEFGTEIPIPADQNVVWASLTFQSPLVGRLLSTVFKRPRLLLDVDYRSGEKRTYRLIAGMSDGFLLSPVIHSARDFAALSAGKSDLLKSREVQSIKLRQESRFPLWGRTFHLTLSPLAFDPHHPVSNEEIYGTSAEGTPIAQVPEGGRCSIDVVGFSNLGPVGIGPDTPSAVVEGWAFMPPPRIPDDTRVQVALTDTSGRTFYSDARRTARPDVTRQVGLSDGALIGFTSTADLRSLHGDLALHIVQRDRDGSAVCQTPAVTIRH